MNILNKRFDPKSEKFLQNEVINNKNLQRYIIDQLGFNFDHTIKFEKAKPYLNRIIPDIKITKNNEILSLVECKGSKINVTDYVRGIGQLFQYEYFFENNIIEENSSDKFSNNFQTLYLYPSEVTIRNDFNISKFKYPSSTRILQVNLENLDNLFVREFTEEVKKVFSKASESLIAISEYYFRDNRIFELYIVINLLKTKFLKGKDFLNRKTLEFDYLREWNTPNNRNWRNAFISLSNIGFINKNNRLTEVGIDVAKYDYYDFCYLIYNSYIKKYMNSLLPILMKSPNLKLSQINKKIKSTFEGKDILFLTESENRYISSWLGILRDDYGIIDYEPRSSIRKINYDPTGMDKVKFINNIAKYSKANEYIRELI